MLRARLWFGIHGEGKWLEVNGAEPEKVAATAVAVFPAAAADLEFVRVDIEYQAVGEPQRVTTMVIRTASLAESLQLCLLGANPGDVPLWAPWDKRWWAWLGTQTVDHAEG